MFLIIVLAIILCSTNGSVVPITPVTTTYALPATPVATSYQSFTRNFNRVYVPTVPSVHSVATTAVAYPGYSTTWSATYPYNYGYDYGGYGYPYGYNYGYNYGYPYNYGHTVW